MFLQNLSKTTVYYSFVLYVIAIIIETPLQKQYAERARRMSTLSRSDAIQGYHPVKQVRTLF